MHSEGYSAPGGLCQGVSWGWDGMGFLVGLAPLGVSGVSGLGEKGCCCWHRIASLTLST